MLSCPRCAAPLKALRYGPLAVWGCAGCGGRAAALALLRHSIAPGRWRGLRRAVALAAAPSGRPCPSCRHAMLAAEADGVGLETCRRCQLLWFDQGEAPEPGPPCLSPEAAEAAARLEVASIERRGRLSDAEVEPLTAWQSLSLRLGLPFELDASPTAIVPWATAGLALGIIAIGLLTLGDLALIQRLGLLPAAPFRYGGATLFTSFFLHAGLVHLFGNAYFLVVFGDNVEEALGWRRFLVLVLIGAVTGAAAHIAFDPRRDVPLIGASGGISTILAFYALRFPGARVGWLLWRLPAAFYFAIWVGFQLLTSIAQAEGSSDVSAFAHLGGAGAGVAFWAIQRRMEAWNCRGAAPS